MRKIAAFSLFSLAFTLPAWAADGNSFSERCPDIETCAKVVGQLLDQKYVFGSDVKGRVQATPNLELTRDNAELLFTSMLHTEGYSRVPLGQPGSFQILRQRDARDSAIPMVTADRNAAPQLPNLWDLMTLRYEATNPGAVEYIARMSRSFMPANARIISDELSGTLLVTDSAMNLKKLYAIIREYDLAPTPEQKKRWTEERKEHERLRKENPGPAVPAPLGTSSRDVKPTPKVR